METELKEIWKSALKLLHDEMGDSLGYAHWIMNIVPVRIADKNLYLSVSDSIHKTIIESRHSSMIREAVRMVTGFYYNLIIVVRTNDASASFVQYNLNNKYTFSSFVVADSNRLAHAASLAVSEAPGTAYNPLFMYGGVGLGKTHLLQAIGNYIVERNESPKVIYIPAETFTNEFINSIRDQTNEKFRNKYRKVDVLLIDDIQFIAGKSRTEEEFFHTFNVLQQSGKQIVITCDRAPKEIQTLEERLRNRFESGIMVDINPPDYETRLAILRKKAQLEDIEINDEILDLIADKIKSNVRELEGVLNRVLAFRSLENRDVTIDSAMEALKDYDYSINKQISAQQIITTVCDYFNLPVESLKSTNRKKNLVHARQIAMYLCKELTSLSTVQAGDLFGRDHTTVIYGANKISAQMQEDDDLKREVEQITEDLKNN